MALCEAGHSHADECGKLRSKLSIPRDVLVVGACWRQHFTATLAS